MLKNMQKSSAVKGNGKEDDGRICTGNSKSSVWSNFFQDLMNEVLCIK